MRAKLKAFSHKIMDWRWEYMEDLFVDLHPIVEEFCGVYNAKALRAASGMEGGEQVLHQKRMGLLEEMQNQDTAVLKFAAQTSSGACLFMSLWKIARWTKACNC